MIKFKRLKLTKWHILLIVFLVFILINGFLFVRKIFIFKKGIETGSIIMSTGMGAYSQYNGSLNTKESNFSRSELESSTSPYIGSSKPIMTIVEFADFNCPHCLKTYTELKLFLKENKNDVKLIYRYFPISNDLTPEFAASCANEQNKFWEMHDKLFENQRILNEEAFIKFAKELGLDVNKFTDCYTSKKYQKDISLDTNLGLRAGIKGTPTFFINGYLFAGVRTKQFLEQVLQVIKNDDLNQK